MSSAGRMFKNWSPESLAKDPREDEGKGERARRTRPEGANGSTEGEDVFFLSSEEVKKVEEAAKKDGYDAGYAEGLERARADMAPLREAWMEWASRIPEFEANRLRSLLPELAGLLSQALRRVLGEEGKKPKALQGLLERMLKEYAAGREAELRVSEGDYRLVTRQDGAFIDDLSSRGVRLTVGQDLTPGQVELRFPDRIVSFDPDTAVDSFRRTIVRSNPGSLGEEPPLQSEEEPNDDRN